MPTAAANPLLTVEQQLWALVLAWTPLTQVVSPRTIPLLKPGNVERFDLIGVRWPGKAQKQAADSVTFSLDIGNGRPDPKAARTLCLQPSIDVVDFNWTLTAPDKRLLDLTQAIAELRACMKAAGVQLGIPDTVARWEWLMRPQSAKIERIIVVTQQVVVKS